MAYEFEFQRDILGVPPAVLIPTTIVRYRTDSGLQEHLMRAAAQLKNPSPLLKAIARSNLKHMKERKLSGQALKARSGHLRSLWKTYRVSNYKQISHPGGLPYSRVHEFGNKEYQFVRGYRTKAGKRVAPYMRDANIKATHYIGRTLHDDQNRARYELQKALDAQLQKGMGTGKS